MDQINSLSTKTGLGYAYFSILAPGTRITRHCGPTNFRLRCHLPLIVPKLPNQDSVSNKQFFWLVFLFLDNNNQNWFVEEDAKNIWQQCQGKCEMRVDREVRPWVENEVSCYLCIAIILEAVVFDDSFEHEVWNLSEETRVVLLIDVWHPDLTPFEIQALQFMFP